jgi:PUA domain protein
MKFLSNKEKKQLILDLPENLSFDKKDELKVDNNGVYYLNGDKFLIRIINKENKNSFFLIPHIDFLLNVNIDKDSFPIVYIDRGAIPFILKGADLMKPGIVNFEGEFKKGDIILIKDFEHKKLLAIGIALYDLNEFRNLDKGKVINILHYYNDVYFK